MAPASRNSHSAGCRGTSLMRNRPPYGPAVGLCLGPYGGPEAGAVAYKQGTPVPRRNINKSKRLSVTSSAGTPLCPYMIADCEVYGCLIKRILAKFICGPLYDWGAHGNIWTVCEPWREGRYTRSRCRAIMAHERQSRPDYGLGFQVEVRKTFQVVPKRKCGAQPSGRYGVRALVTTQMTKITTPVRRS